MWLPILALSALWAAGERTYELTGQILPESKAAVALHGATTPFSDSALADPRGRFRFTRLLPGAYTVSAFVPGQGEARQTIEIGPSLADEKGRIAITLRIEESKLTPDHSSKVSARELSIPDRARKEYSEAQKKLSKRDVAGAVARLKRAVEIAPQFSEAWNNLGTIAYQSGEYPDAEKYFRESLLQDPSSYAPLVNLGGVLLNLNKLDEAWKYNLYAVLQRPNDALANSQLGMTYFHLGKLDLSEKYLLLAQGLDPAHFSHPQLLLAEIYLRRKNYRAAADELEHFLKHHPDWPAAEKIRSAIRKLRSGEAGERL